jgi:hypothetical protein
MDHLTTDLERKDRWYAKDVIPNYVKVHSIDLATASIRIRTAAALSVQSACTAGDTAAVDTGAIQQKAVLLPSSLLTSVPGIPAFLLVHQEMQQYMKLILRKHGFVVIQQVMNDQECDEAISLAWDYIEAASQAQQRIHSMQRQEQEQEQEHLQEQEHSSLPMHTTMPTSAASMPPPPPPVHRNDPSTYASLYYPRSVEGHIFPYYGSGHSTFMWHIRSNPNVQRVFSSLCNVRPVQDNINATNTNTNTNITGLSCNLKTSLDGLILWNTYQHEKRHQQDRGWFHIDQNPITKPLFASYQGLVNILPTTPSTGGNVMIANSHLIFPQHYVNRQQILCTCACACNAQPHNSTSSSDCNLFYQERLKEINGDDWLEIDPHDTILLPSAAECLQPQAQRDNIACTCMYSYSYVHLW